MVVPDPPGAGGAVVQPRQLPLYPLVAREVAHLRGRAKQHTGIFDLPSAFTEAWMVSFHSSKEAWAAPLH